MSRYMYQGIVINITDGEWWEPRAIHASNLHLYVAFIVVWYNRMTDERLNVVGQNDSPLLLFFSSVSLIWMEDGWMDESKMLIIFTTH